MYTLYRQFPTFVLPSRNLKMGVKRQQVGRSTGRSGAATQNRDPKRKGWAEATCHTGCRWILGLIGGIIAWSRNGLDFQTLQCKVQSKRCNSLFGLNNLAENEDHFASNQPPQYCVRPGSPTLFSCTKRNLASQAAAVDDHGVRYGAAVRSEAAIMRNPSTDNPRGLSRSMPGEPRL